MTPMWTHFPILPGRRMITYHHNSILTAVHCARRNCITNKLAYLRTRPICTQRTFAARTTNRGLGHIGHINRTVTPAYTPTIVFLLGPQSSRHTMAIAARDVHGQSDISQMNTEQDGSFRRKLPAAYPEVIASVVNYIAKQEAYFVTGMHTL